MSNVKKTAKAWTPTQSGAVQLNNGVTAHRGDSGWFPENTLPAFESGIELGADWIELDILRSKDGKLGVLHDRTTERVGYPNLEWERLTHTDKRARSH